MQVVVLSLGMSGLALLQAAFGLRSLQLSDRSRQRFFLLVYGLDHRLCVVLAVPLTVFRLHGLRW